MHLLRIEGALYSPSYGLLNEKTKVQSELVTKERQEDVAKPPNSANLEAQEVVPRRAQGEEVGNRQQQQQKLRECRRFHGH